MTRFCTTDGLSVEDPSCTIRCVDTQQGVLSDVGTTGVDPRAGRAHLRGGVRRRRARVVLTALIVGALLVVVVGAVAGVLGDDGSSPNSDPATASCAGLPGRAESPVPGVTAALIDVPTLIDPGRVVWAGVMLSLDTGRPPVTLNLVGGDSAELFLIGDGTNLVGSGNFAHLAVGPIPRTVDDRGLSLDAAGGAYRCADLDDPAADLNASLPPGDYQLEGVVHTDAGDIVTPTVRVHLQ